MPIGASVSLNTDRSDVSQQNHRELPYVAVQSSGRQFLASDGVGLAEDRQSLLINGPDDANRKPRPRERVSPHDLRRQAEVESHLPHLVLEQGAQRLHERELEILRQASNVVMALDVRRAGSTTGLDDIRIERALDEELNRLAVRTCLGDEIALGRLEHPDELAADDLALGLRIAHSCECLEEALLRINHDESNAGRCDVVPLDLLRLPLAQETVIDEDAGELVAHGLVHQRCRHGGVDSTGQPADHLTGTHLFTDALDLIVDDALHGPGGLTAGDVDQKVLEDPLTVLAVKDLRVELDAGEPPSYRFESRDGSTI